MKNESAGATAGAPLSDESVERGENKPRSAEHHPQLEAGGNRSLPTGAAIEEADDHRRSTWRSGGEAVSTIAAVRGQRIGDYRLLRELGRGGMGVVYEAEQLSLNRRVALKILPAQVAGDQQLMSRFRREARAAARLHHPNIVPVFDVGEDGQVSYYAMQLIDGQSLDGALQELRHLREHGRHGGKDRAQAGAADDFIPVTESLVTVAFEPLGSETNTQAGSTRTGVREDVDETSDFSFDDQDLPSDQGIPPRAAYDDTTASSASLPGQQESASGEFSWRHYYRAVAVIGIQVADALAHAHRAGILHRDIKPSNLLLDPAGRAWVTDFGLAKTEGGDDLTQTGDVLGTLRYMPPERFAGWSDPRSDIYSLGVTLYEMLALHPAFDEPDRLKLIQEIAHRTPDRLRRIDPQIPVDLETIIFKAIDREPSRRYASADELKDDLQRFLDDKPIAARRTTGREQIWRWCRRNPAVAVLAGSLASLLLVLAIASAVAAFHFRRIALEREAARDLAVQREAEAHRNFAMARDAVDRYLVQVSDDPRLESFGLETLRRELLATAHEFYAQMVQYDSRDPELRSEQGRAFSSLAAITKELGSIEEASALYRQSEDVFRELIRAHPEVSDYRATLANVLSDQGNLLRETERAQEAEAAYDEALELRQYLVREHPGEPQYVHDLLKIQSNLGSVYSETRRYQQAESAYQDALTLYERLPYSVPADLDYRLSLGKLKNNFGVLYHRTGKLEPAEQSFRTAIEVHQELIVTQPTNPKYRAEVVLSMKNLAIVLAKAKRDEEAEAAYLEAVEASQRLVADHPDMAYYRAEAVSVLGTLGSFYVARKQQQQAETTLQQAAEQGKQLATNHPDMPKGQLEAAYALYNLGRFYQTAGRDEDAEAAYSDLIEVKERLRRMNPSAAGHRRELSSYLTKLGNLYVDLKQYGQAEETLTSALKLREQLAEEFPNDIYYQTQLGGSYANLARAIRISGRTKGFLPWQEQAVRVLQAAHARAPANVMTADYLTNAVMGRAIAYEHLKRGEDALADYRAAIAVAEKMAAERPGDAKWPEKLQLLYYRMSIYLEGQKRYEEADQAFAATRHWLEKLVRDNPDSAIHRRSLGETLYHLGRFLRLRGQAEEALRWQTTVIETLTPLHERSPGDQTARKYLRFAYYERARSYDALGNEEAAAAARARAKSL